MAILLPVYILQSAQPVGTVVHYYDAIRIQPLGTMPGPSLMVIHQAVVEIFSPDQSGEWTSIFIPRDTLLTWLRTLISFSNTKLATLEHVPKISITE